MPSLMVAVFVLQLVIYCINTVGAPVIDELLWVLYSKLPTSTSRDASKQTALRREVVKLKQELNATSSQDEFAKWARIKRSYDKKLAEHDEKANKLKDFKTTFDRGVKALRFLSTNGLRLFLQFYYTKQPMYWIPHGWAPGYVEWALSFPRAPRGSVSIQIWGIACATVIQIVGAAVVAGLVLVRADGQQKANEKAEKTKNGRAEAMKKES